MAYSPPDSVSAATPIGLLGEPPAMTFGRRGLSRLTSAGGDHAGRTCLPSTARCPNHCLPGRPTADGVAERGAVAEHEVEAAFAGPHDDRAGPHTGLERDHLTGVRRRSSARHQGRQKGDPSTPLEHSLWPSLRVTVTGRT